MNKKKLLIVGASSTIGCELLSQIGDEDSTILAHYHSGKERIEEVRKQSKARIVPVEADISLEAGALNLVSQAKSLYECPDRIVFLAAPSYAMTRFKDLTWNDFRTQLDMQLHTACTILQNFLPFMSTAKYGKVVFMLSSSTLGIPPASMAHYVTAKYAMLGLMKSLAAEYSSKKICINAVSPTMIETKFLSQIPEKIVEFTAQQHPQKRNGMPSDVVPVIKFLLSDEAGFITGVNLPVTGGA